MLKKQLLKSCALALLLGAFSWGAHAVITYDEDELSQKTTPALPNLEVQRADPADVYAVEIPHGTPVVSDAFSLGSLLGELGQTNPIRAAILSRLEPRDVLKLSVTSRAMNTWVGEDLLKEARTIERLRALALDINLEMYERIPAAAALPAQDAERDQLLRAWARNNELNPGYRIWAAKNLPLEDEERNQLLRAVVLDPNQEMHTQLGAAAALPRQDAERNQILRAWAGDVNLDFNVSLAAASALPSEERNQILRAWAGDVNLDFNDRLAAASALPSEERNQILRAMAQDPNQSIYHRFLAAERLPDGPDKEAIFQNLSAIEAMELQ